MAYEISPEEVDAELVRFHQALQTTADQIRTLRERMIQISGEKDASIFDAHILLLQDKVILQQVQTELLKRLQNVEHIFYVVMQNYMEVLRRVDDPYLRAKTADMEDVMQRVINNLRSTEPLEDEEEAEEAQVLVAYDLTPSDTAAMDCQPDSRLCHGNRLLRFPHRHPRPLHGHSRRRWTGPGPPAGGKPRPRHPGRLQGSAHPEAHAGDRWSTTTASRMEKEKAYKALEALRDLPTITRDGRNIRLSVNVEFPHEYSGIKEVGAEGVGLFRTEFFLLGNPAGMPDEEEQTRYYKKLGGRLRAPRRHLRTLDSGRRQAAVRAALYAGT